MSQLSFAQKLKEHPNIWLLAFGYFFFYTPYSAMTKALSKGLLPGSTGTISGFELLPTVIIGTLIMFLIIITVMGWWKHAGRIEVLGVKIPFATSKWTFFSGVGAAAIIATTTLAYTFEGISIVFAALLMRGGVLLMAPLWDTFYKREVRWYSWVAFGLSFMALIMLFSEKGGYLLTLIAALNILTYLSGYFFRLRFMTGKVKVNNKAVSYKFFIEEMLAAMLVLLVVPIVLAIIGQGTIMEELRYGFTTFIQSSLAIPALIIGILYSCLYIFGTRIYLDHRENTFCIPINRCSSLLAGVVASFVLGFIFNESFVSNMQLISAGVLIISILFLSFPAFSKKEQRLNTFTPPERNFVFVCSSNTSRSPMAQAICIDEMTKLLRRKGIDYSNANMNVWSAGLTATQGTPLSANAKLALGKLKVPVIAHASKNLETSDIEKADTIFCMSSDQKQKIINTFPIAENKVTCLDEQIGIQNPAGGDLKNYLACAQQIRGIIKQKVTVPQLLKTDF